MRYSIDPKDANRINNDTGKIGTFNLTEEGIVFYCRPLDKGINFDDSGYLVPCNPLPKADGYVVYSIRCMIFEIRTNVDFTDRRELLKQIFHVFNLTDKRVDLVIGED